jgi:hypothetical protein
MNNILNFLKGVGLSKVSDIMVAVKNLTTILHAFEQVTIQFESEYMKDKNIRNATIDTLIDVLNGHKIT